MNVENREYIKKIYSQQSNSNDREHEIEEESCYKPFKSDMIKRDEFTKDKDRIIFTRVFRRLSHKSQIYSFTKGDHFRNRLTHSIEVSQIAKSISSNLGLNTELTEAISLGHDIGHTPFGHAGEKALDKIMRGETNLDNVLKYKINYGGFKHNFQSLKTLDILERKFESIKGLNLTWQVKDGVLKHTRTKRNCDRKKCDCGDCWDLSRFIQSKNVVINYLKNKEFPCTLEGQVVEIADEIAQRQHDLDDGLRDKSNDSQYEDISAKICEFVDLALSNYNDDDKNYIKFAEDLKDKVSSRTSEDIKTKICRRDALIRDVIEFFILDVTHNSFKKILNDEEKSIRTFESIKYVDDILIKFSSIGSELSKSIEKYVENNIHKSRSVKKSDGNAKFMIKLLFKEYYQKPELLTPYGKFRLNERIKNNYNKIYHLKINNEQDLNGFNPDEDLEDKLIRILQLNMGEDDLLVHSEWSINLNDLNGLAQEINIKKINELTNDKEKFIKCLLENHFAYLSVICDHIAGMTDNYAREQFCEIFLA